MIFSGLFSIILSRIIFVLTFSGLMQCVKRDTILKNDPAEETICHELQ